MHVDQEVFQLRQRVTRLERQVALLMERLGVEYEDEVEDVLPEVLHALQRGRKIEAIRRYREATGATLRAAKTYVESLMQEE
jgi:ribosomal protein L7/L12